MKLVYASRMGKTETFVNKLGMSELLKIENGSEVVAGDYILVTYTDGKGIVPSVVEAFLQNNKEGLKAVVACGSMARHADTFCFAGDIISKMYNVPCIAKVDGEGTDADVATVQAGIASL